MRNAKIFSFVRISENSMVASVRIARWLSEYLAVPLVTDESIAAKALDTLIIVNGAYGFSKFLEPLGKAILEARRVVWVQNDYTIIPPKDVGDAQSPFRRAFVLRKQEGKMPTSYWSTCEEWSARPGSTYVNWNMLTFDENYDPKVIRMRRRQIRTESLFYYGSYRDGSGKSSRVPLFDRYFENPHATTVISSPVDKFSKRYPKCIHEGAIQGNFYDTLGRYGLGLYIEDRKSSENFHSPANRFYEMLSAGLPMVFQPECGPMLRRAGYDPTRYVVEKVRDVRRVMEMRESIGEEQRRLWVPGTPHFFRDQLIAQINHALTVLS
jgi:hypothetical protein